MIQVLEFQEFDRYLRSHYRFPEHLEMFVKDAWMNAVMKVKDVYQEFKDLEGWTPCTHEKMKEMILRNTKEKCIQLGFELFWFSEEH